MHCLFLQFCFKRLRGPGFPFGIETYMILDDKFEFLSLRGPGFPFGIETSLTHRVPRQERRSERAWLPVWD